MTDRNPQMGGRKEWIDISRGIAIVLVVIGHSLQTVNLVFGYHPNPWLDRIIYSFHMPFFFLLSGYLFKQRDKLKTKFLHICLTNFQRLVLPCLGTILIVFLYMYFITSKVQNLTLSGSFVGELVMVLLYGSGKPPQFSTLGGLTSPFWFLLCLFAANIIFWLIMKVTEGRSVVVRGLIVIAMSYLGVFIGERQKLYLPWSLDIAFASQIFVFAGYMINTINFAGKKVGLHLSIIFISLCVSALDIWMGGISLNERVYNNFAISASGGITGSIVLLYFSYSLGRLSLPFNAAFFSLFTPLIGNITSAISCIGREALIIYCLHVMDMSFFGWFYLQANLLNLIVTNWAILTFFRLFYSMTISDLIRHVPIMRSLFYWKDYPISISSIAVLK